MSCIVECTKKKWRLLTESKAALLFLLTATVQAIVLIYLQTRILARNTYVWYLHPNEGDVNCIESDSFGAFMLLTFENVVFIFLYVFQLYFCINALLNKNTIQIFTIALTNFCCVVLGVIQLLEAQEANNKMANDCPAIVFDPEVMIVEVPNIIIITVLAFVMGYFSFKLYQQFGWDIYQKIGGDVQMQSRYRTRLIFLMLLKLDLLLMLLFSILIIPYYIYDNKELVYVDFVFFILVFLFETLAFKSISREYKAGMVAFSLFWVVVMIVYGWFCYVGFSLAITYKLYTGAIFGAFFMLFGASTFIIGISITRNFGKGLKEYLDKDVKGKKVEDI